MKKEKSDMRQRVLDHIASAYGVKEEHLWEKSPESMIFRHGDNQKWFALFMTVKGERLSEGLPEVVDIVDLRCPDYLLREALLGRRGYYPGYHMHKGYWISLVLDGSVPWEEIVERIEDSFLCTASKEERDKRRPPKAWLIPANPKYYDVEEAFRRERIIDWKQGRGIREGDMVYMYVAAPVSAILYECRVLETMIPYDGRAEKVNITHLMNIELLRTYERDRFPLSLLAEKYDVRYIRGPRGVPSALLEDLQM